jgi:hypothetical protein
VVGIGWGDASRAQRRAFVAVVALGVVVRVVVLASKWRDGLLLNDSFWYSAQAVELARGHGFRDPFYGGPSAEHGPLTPLLLAAVSRLDDPVPWQRLVMTVLGTLTVVAIGLLARRVAGWWAAVAAAAIAAVYPNLWMNDSLVMSETPAALLVVVVLWLGLDVAAGSGLGRAVALGVAIGLAALARSELVLLLPILLVVLVRARRGDTRRLAVAGALAAGTLAALAPWVVPNLVRFDRPVLLTTNDGTTLLGANCDDSWHGSDVGGWSLFCVVDEGAPEGEDPSIRSARHRRLAFEYVRDHADRLPVVLAARVGRGLDVVGLRNLVAADRGEERYGWASWAGIVAWWLLAPLAVLGAVRVQPPPRWVLLAPVVSVAITTVLFYGGHRIRSPMEPVVAVLAGVAIASLLAPRDDRDGRLDDRAEDADRAVAP